jgi:hypothetical protein
MIARISVIIAGIVHEIAKSGLDGVVRFVPGTLDGSCGSLGTQKSHLPDRDLLQVRIVQFVAQLLSVVIHW